jgi:hypothetical protein
MSNFRIFFGIKQHDTFNLECKTVGNENRFFFDLIKTTEVLHFIKIFRQSCLLSQILLLNF